MKSAPFTFTGLVLEEDGTPAEDALVVSSAGGQAITDENGEFLLDTELPIGTQDVKVTAAGSSSKRYFSHLQVTLATSARRMRVGPLVLNQSGAFSPSWLPTFGGRPGANRAVNVMEVFDDGAGQALYAGGSFDTIGGQSAAGIAKWNGNTWTALGSGITGTVESLQVYDDGNGEALYVGGSILTAGGMPVPRLAKWDGTSWAPVGSGSNVLSAFSVRALTVFDDGGGLALYAGGSIFTANGNPVNGIAKWDGASWSGLGSGVSGGSLGSDVRALTVFDDGNGPALFAGGNFTIAGGVAAGLIARWDGQSWSALGSGLSLGVGQPSVEALIVFDDGRGPALYAGGSFLNANASTVMRIGRWDGSTWSKLGAGIGTLFQHVSVFSLSVFDDGSGSGLYVGGDFRIGGGGRTLDRIAKWDGLSWSKVGSGFVTNTTGRRGLGALAVFDDDSGAALYAGGGFQAAGSFAAKNMARWDGEAWRVFGKGLNAPIDALIEFDDGRGEALYAAGLFTVADGIEVQHIAKWDGSGWTALAGGLDDQVHALAVFDDGAGAALYAAGVFLNADGIAANQIARWDGSGWSALGSGLQAGLGSSSSVRSLIVFDDGRGAALYAAGQFTLAGGAQANDIARWDGVSWSALGQGIGAGPSSAQVRCMSLYNDGQGQALYVAGGFSLAGGLPALNIAKWDGLGWAPLGSGIVTGSLANVEAMAVFGDGAGDALYAGGSIQSAGGLAVNNIASWDGSEWTGVGAGTNNKVHALYTHDDGSGAALYAGGSFTMAGTGAARAIAKWDGSHWSPLGGGMVSSVTSMASFDFGAGANLFAGGPFTRAIDTNESYLARWGCADTTPPELRCPSSFLVFDRRANGPGECVTFEVPARDDRDPAPSVVCTPASGSFFSAGKTLVTCTASDASGNQASCHFIVTVHREGRH